MTVVSNPLPKLYQDSSTNSEVKQVLPPNTQMMMEQAILGPDGTPTWYYVTELYHYKFYGFIPAGEVRCPGVTNSPS